MSRCQSLQDVVETSLNLNVVFYQCGKRDGGKHHRNELQQNIHLRKAQRVEL